MSFLLLAAAAGASAAPQWHRDGAFPAVATVHAMVEGCGVEGAEARYDELYQDDIIIIPEGMQLEDGQLECLAHVAFDTGHEMIVPQVYLASFYQHRAEISEPWNIELASNWLAERGLLEDLPVRGEDEAVAVFARRLERHCNAEGALASQFGPNAVSPDWIMANGRSGTNRDEAIFCLFSAGTASGFPIGFIGNEKLRGEGPED